MVAQRTVQRHHSLVAETVMTLVTDNGGVSVDTGLMYHSCDPYAVRLVFSIPGIPAVEWVFSRELLFGGLTIPAGAGDVQVFPTHDGLVIELNSPGGRARLVADRTEVGAFVTKMITAVPLGDEHNYYDIDLELALLAGSEASGIADF